LAQAGHVSGRILHIGQNGGCRIETLGSPPDRGKHLGKIGNQVFLASPQEVEGRQRGEQSTPSACNPAWPSPLRGACRSLQAPRLRDRAVDFRHHDGDRPDLILVSQPREPSHRVHWPESRVCQKTAGGGTRRPQAGFDQSGSALVSGVERWVCDNAFRYAVCMTFPGSQQPKGLLRGAASSDLLVRQGALGKTKELRPSRIPRASARQKG